MNKTQVPVLFRPLVAILDRLRFAAKFGALGALFLVPLLFVAYSQWSSTTYDIDFNALERDGVTYIEPLRKLSYAVQRRAVVEMAMARNPRCAATRACWRSCPTPTPTPRPPSPRWTRWTRGWAAP